MYRECAKNLILTTLVPGTINSGNIACHEHNAPKVFLRLSNTVVGQLLADILGDHAPVQESFELLGRIKPAVVHEVVQDGV